MDLATINVVLTNNNDYIFHSGDVIEGTLEIEIPRPTKLKGIYIKFNGSGHVEFRHRVRTTKYGPPQNILFSANEEYIDHKVYCLKNTGDAINLTKGRHVYPFTYHLPSTLPSTYEHDLGANIEYCFKVVLKQSNQVKQEEIRKFVVVSPLNLCLNPALLVPTSTCIERKRIILWHEVTKLKINVTIPRSGYAMGEAIAIHTEVQNNSAKNISDIYFDLQKIIKVNANTPQNQTKIVSQSLANINLGPQPCPSSQTFNNEMTIPFFDCYNVNGSKIISITYELQVVCVRSEPYGIMNEKIPITIGSWPTVQPLQYTDAPKE